MTRQTNPRVLFVDDDNRTSPRQVAEALAPFQVDTRLRTPEQAFATDLAWADLVIVDYFLTDWPERNDTLSVARSPRDGLAAAASMRSTLLPPLSGRGPGNPSPRSVAFALWSSNLREAAFDLPDVVLPHVFSRDNNLEWAFRREDLLLGPGAEQVAVLARAVTALPEIWPLDQTQAEGQMLDMLGLPSDSKDFLPWQSDAQRDVLRCRPPLHELSARSHGLALVRWLLHRIFPYPCFLLDDLQLRARLRVEGLSGAHGERSDLLDALQPYEYGGTLAGFKGRRWWRAGVEDWLFVETSGQSGSGKQVRDLARRLGATSDRDWIRPVVVVNGDLARSQTFAEVEDTVRVRPDDWPVFADDAFALRTQASEDPVLRALVDPADRPFVDSQIRDEGR